MHLPAPILFPRFFFSQKDKKSATLMLIMHKSFIKLEKNLQN